MKLAIARAGVFVLFAFLLQSCGGGDGDGDGGNPLPVTRLTVTPGNISVSATPGDFGPTGIINLSVSNPPEEGLYAGTSYSNSGIDFVNFISTSQTEARYEIAFRLPGMLPNGTYTDTIEIQICVDDQCATQIQGSPVTITTTYAVSGIGVTGTLDRNSIEVTADSRDQNQLVETARITFDRAAAAGIYLQTNQTTNAVQYVQAYNQTETVTDVEIRFQPGYYLSSGTFNDTITVTACYDYSCARQLSGSPYTISTKVDVSVGAEPGFTPLEVASRVALPHDVVDAEYSKALNRIVMVGSYPVNALYLYDGATGAEVQQSLVKAPTSVSIAPDGLTAAVGHDALISIVDLSTVGQAAAPAPILLNVSAEVYDIVLDGAGYVHAFPAVDQWVAPHSIHIATNTEQEGTGFLYAGAHARLHPSGGFIYEANNGLSPSDIAKWDISTGVANVLYDSPYHGDYEMCGDLWFNESGSTIYTACGNTFRSSQVQAQDMVYSGALTLSTNNSPYWGFIVKSLSQLESRKEIVLVEVDLGNCTYFSPSGPCYTHLAFYESDFLNRQAVYTIGPVTVNDQAYAQRGMFVFHDAVGTQKYMLSRLEGMPNADAEYYFSVIE